MANAVHADLEDVRDGLLEKETVGPSEPDLLKESTPDGWVVSVEKSKRFH